MKKFSLLLILLLSAVLYAEIPVHRLNREIGLPLLGEKEGELWDFAECKKRLHRARIILQSSPGRHSSFLRSRKFFGEECRELEIITDRENRSIESISLIFANKGDVAKRAGTKIRRADRGITRELTTLLGKPRRVKVDPGTKKLRSNVEFWQCGYAELLLDTEKGEYCIVTIRPAEKESEKKPRRVDVSSLQKNVKKNDFGDVFIANIPMVNQGMKGYCAVATAQRVMLYYGIKELNQHKLADAADTDAGGGTYSHKLINALNPLCRKYNLKFYGSRDVEIKHLAGFIDRGVPLFWQMFSTEQYNELRYKHNGLRRRAVKNSTPEKWKKRVQKQKKLRKSDEGPHLCLIIGYNAATGEIAVSNSWGEKENLPSWVPLKAAEVVNRGVFTFSP